MNSEADFVEQVRLHLPPYLSAEGKNELIRQIREHLAARAFNLQYFAVIDGAGDPLQGDGWQGLCAIAFDTCERERVIGLVLSNSCDIQKENNPDRDQRLLFAPILDLGRYCEFRRESGDTEEQINEFLRRVRRQEIYRIFYIPEMHGRFGESLVPLDVIHSQPLGSVDIEPVNRVFSLNMFGWYMLLLKLSIHFTRMQESLERTTSSTTA